MLSTPRFGSTFRHFWRTWSAWKCSRRHLCQNCSTRYWTWRKRFLLNLPSSWNTPGSWSWFPRSINNGFGVSGPPWCGSMSNGVSGRELKDEPPAIHLWFISSNSYLLLHQNLQNNFIGPNYLFPNFSHVARLGAIKNRSHPAVR